MGQADLQAVVSMPFPQRLTWTRAQLTHGDFQAHLESWADGVSSHFTFFPPFFPLKLRLQALTPQFNTFFVTRSDQQHVKQERPFMRWCSDKPSAAVDH